MLQIGKALYALCSKNYSIIVTIVVIVVVIVASAAPSIELQLEPQL